MTQGYISNKIIPKPWASLGGDASVGLGYPRKKEKMQVKKKKEIKQYSLKSS